MSETKLKPCPFCGSKATITCTGGDGYTVQCVGIGCYAQQKCFTSDKEKAVLKWNEREKSCALYTDYKKSCQALKDHEAQKGNLQRVSDCLMCDICRYRDLTDCGDNCRHRS